MSPVRKTASLSPSTVTKVSKGVVASRKKAKPRTPAKRLPTTRAASRKSAAPIVYQAALKLAGGDAKRLIVESYNQILVTNRREQP